MNIDEIIKNNGVVLKNPNYTKNGKNGPAFYSSANIAASPTYGEAVAGSVNASTFNLSHLGNTDEYTDRGIVPGRYDSPQSLKRELANKQSAWEQFGNMLVQSAVGEVGLGTVEGFSNLFDFAIGHWFDEGPNDYTNTLSSDVENLKEQLRQAFPIYKKEEGSTIKTGGALDFGWWMSNAPSVMSSLSLLIPGRAGTSLLGKLGSGVKTATKAATASTRAGRIVNNISNKTKFGRFVKAAGVENTTANALVETASVAGFSRILENYQESAQVYKNVLDTAINTFNDPNFDKEKFIQENTDEKGNFEYSTYKNTDGSYDWEGIAKNIANQSANEDFKDNLSNFFFDFLQIYALRNFAKGFKNKNTSPELERFNTQAAKSYGKSAAELATANTKTNKILGWLGDRTKGLGLTIGAEASEGVEEMVNYVSEQEGIHLGNVLLGNETDNSFDDRLPQYLKDGQLWDSALWGLIGGVVFQGLGSGFNKVYNKLNNIKYNEIEDRKAEISSRKQKFDDFVNRLELIDKGYNIYSRKAKKDIPENATGAQLYNKFEAFEGDAGSIASQQLEAKKRLTDEVMTELIINAASEGNLDLLKTYLKDPNIQEQLGLKNVEQAKEIDVWNDYVTSKINDVESRMDNVITYLNDLDVPAHYIRMIATDNVRQQLDNNRIREDINSLNSIISEYIHDDAVEINETDALDYQRKIKAETLLTFIRTLQEQRKKLEKINTISSQIGIREIDRQIEVAKRTINDEFSTYIDYQSNVGFNDEEAQKIRDKWIEEHSDDSLSADENKRVQGLNFDKLVSIHAYSNLLAQQPELARLYNQLANFEIANEISEEDVKLNKDKVKSLIAQYDSMFDRAKQKVSNKASDILKKMFAKYNEDEVLDHIENKDNEIEGISKKDLASLDDAIKALDLLNPDNIYYMDGIKKIHLEAKLKKIQDTEIHGENEDEGQEEDNEGQEGGAEVQSEDPSTGGAQQTQNPFNPDGSVNSDNGGSTDPILQAKAKVLSRPFTQRDNRSGVPLKTNFEIGDIQPGDIIEWGDSVNHKPVIVLAVYDNPQHTMDILNLENPRTDNDWGYEIWPIFPRQVIEDKDRDLRVQQKEEEARKQQEEFLADPEINSWSDALHHLNNTPNLPDGSIDYNTIGSKIVQTLTNRGVALTDAQRIAVKHLKKIQQLWGNKRYSNLQSNVAELLLHKSYTTEYREQVKKLVDKFITETSNGKKINNRRIISLEAFLRYLHVNNVQDEVVDAVYKDLVDYLLKENAKTRNKTYVLIDDSFNLNNNLLSRSRMTVAEANDQELASVENQRVDISSIIDKLGIDKFNKLYDKLKVGDKLDYIIENGDIKLLDSSGEVIGRLPIVSVDSDKNSKTYGAYRQLNDGWYTDIKPVNGRIDSRFIKWLKDYISDPDSELFKLIYQYAYDDTANKDNLIEKIIKTTGWRSATTMKLYDTTKDKKDLINGIVKLFKYTSNSNNAQEYRDNYDHWARKLLQSYSSISNFVNASKNNRGSIVVDYVTEGKNIQVAFDEADVPSKTIAKLNHKIHKIASFYSDKNNPTTGIDISGETSPFIGGRNTGSLSNNLRAGRSFLMIPNRSGSPTFIQTFAIDVNDVSSIEGKKFIAAIKNEMYVLMQTFANTGKQEDFDKLVKFVNDVFSTAGNESSIFYAKDYGTHRGFAGSRAINIDLGVGKFVIFNVSKNNTKTSIFSVNGKTFNLDKQGIVDGITEVFNNLVIRTDNSFVKNDSKARAQNGIFSWNNGKFTIKTMYYNKSYDSYNQFMLENDLLKCRTKIENGSNFTTENRALRVKLLTGSLGTPVTVPTNDVAPKIKQIFNRLNGNKSRQILRAIFPKGKMLNNVLSLPIFEENINFVDENIGAIGKTLLQDEVIGGKQFRSGDIVYGREFLNEASTDPNRAGLDVIHENLHKVLRQPKNRKILRNIYRIYDEYLDSLDNEENIKKFAEANGVAVSDLKLFFESMNNAISGHETSDLDVEEFLVQSLTNRTLANYLNSIDATDYVKDDSHMTLWQKILKFVQELFGMSTREGSLREKEYYALSDLFSDDKYELKNRTSEPSEPSDKNEPSEPNTPVSKPTHGIRRGPRRSSLFSNVGEVVTNVINIDTYKNSFHVDLQPEVQRLIDSGTLVFTCKD